jgi:hypothetical protein
MAGYRNHKLVPGGDLILNEKYKEEVCKVEIKKFTRYQSILEWVVLIFLTVGIVTAALNVSLGGFTPLLWFVLSFGLILAIICMEVSMIRAFLESRTKNRAYTLVTRWNP